MYDLAMRHILLFVPLLLLMAACDSVDTVQPAPTITVAPTSAAPSPTESLGSSPAAEPSAIDPAPQGYLDELAVIDPRLVDDRTAALERGQNTCADLDREVAEEQLLTKVRERFSTGGLALDDEQTRRVLDAVRRRLC